MKLLLFDIDGTLLLTNGAGTRAASRAFEKLHGVSGAMEEIDAAGKTDPLILKEMYNKELGRHHTEQEAEQIYRHYISYLKEEIKASEITIMPGIKTLLTKLSVRDDLLLGVATGNIEESAWIKLRHSGLDAHFGFGGYGSDSELRKDLIRRAVERAQEHMSQKGDFEKIFVIGDTPFDIIHGKAAGARTVAVATGSYTVEELGEHSPDYLYDDLTDLKSILRIFS